MGAKAATVKPKKASPTPGALGPTAGDHVSVVDVGHGNCAVLASGSETAIIDAGPGASVLEFLRDRGIREVADIFISHADQDHVAGLLALLGESTIKVHRIHLNADSMKGSEIWDDLLWELEAQRLSGLVQFNVGLQAGKGFVCGAISISVIAPSPYLLGKGAGSTDHKGKAITSNSISAVMRVGVGKERGILFAGDLDAIGLADIQRCGTSLDADVLVYPHHGGLAGKDSSAFAKELAKAVGAKHVIFSMQRQATGGGNPRPEVVGAVREALPKARVACTQLSAHCAGSPPPKHPKHLLSLFSRGREKRACCSGTMVVDLPIKKILPRANEHLAFIKEHAPTNMCTS